MYLNSLDREKIQTINNEKANKGQVAVKVKNHLLSIIIPIYNVKDYLSECVESILSQTDQNFEVILVDDGSTDISGNICDEFAKNDERIVVIHKDNGGLASARNTGLEIARGKYVAFVDSDDRIANDAMEKILDWTSSHDIDLCFLQAVKFYPDGLVKDLGDGISKKAINCKKKIDVLKYIASKPKFPGSSCTKIYRREFLQNKQIHFPHERVLSEDLGFVRDCIYLASTYDCLDIPYYEYRQRRKGSITNSTSTKSLDGLIEFINISVGKLTTEKKCNNKEALHMMSCVAYEYCILLLNYASYIKSIEKYNQYKRFLIDNKWVLEYSKNKRVQMISIMVTILGIDRTAKLLKKVKATGEIAYH